MRGSVFSEWCKAVASDTFRMAVNEAEARMKSKAGVIGRSEDGELVCIFFVENEMESFFLFCITRAYLVG